MSTSRWQKEENISLNGKKFSLGRVIDSEQWLQHSGSLKGRVVWCLAHSDRGMGVRAGMRTTWRYLEGVSRQEDLLGWPRRWGLGTQSKLKFRCSKENKLRSNIPSSRSQSACPLFLLTSSFVLFKGLPFPSGVLIQSLPSVWVLLPRYRFVFMNVNSQPLIPFHCISYSIEQALSVALQQRKLLVGWWATHVFIVLDVSFSSKWRIIPLVPKEQ